ncbi:MAG: hypothetical protein AB8G22_20960 [Saprospiraceae bacterium]
MQKLILSSFLLLFSIAVFAQSPQLFSYQGLARDGGGTPFVNQNISLRISIVQSSPTGQTIFQETHNTVTNSVGIFSIQVGGGTPNMNSLADVNWSEGAHFLKTELDALGGTNYEMVGITQLISVPYALYAGNGSEWEQENEGLFYDKGQIRIGQEGAYYPSPYNLHVIGDNDGKTRLTVEAKNDDAVGIHIWSNTNTVPSGGTVDGATIGYKRASDILKINNSTSFFNDNHLTLTKSGNVGLGTEDAKAKLHIEDGDIYLKEIGRGVIMRSPNGNCWRMTIDDNGDFVKTQITCP